MALRDRIDADINRVFMQHDHFAEWHSWNGVRIQCVTDEEEALKRKNNNVNDISWQWNTRDVLVYTPVEGFPGKPEPNTHILWDHKPMRIVQFSEDFGMYAIVIASFDTMEMV